MIQERRAMSPPADRNLLFGLLALQTGMIDQSALVAAFHAWTRDKARSLAELLIDQGALDDSDREVLEVLAAKQLQRHCDDVAKSLAAVPASSTLRSGLAGIGDVDIAATIGHMSSPSHPTENDGNGAVSETMSMGGVAGDGQRFRVLRPHARGGLGEVFVALDAELNREVALKQILDHHADDPNSRTRFVLEAEITGGLEHPGIVPVYGLGSYGSGRPYYAMRFVRGDSLKDAIVAFHADPKMMADLGRRSLALRKLLRRFTDVCNAIEYAHTRGVIHRDIKPANVIVGKHGETLVVDWGLAKALGRAEPGAASEERTLIPSTSSGSAETLPGSALGTPAFMSPEQAVGDLDRLGPRSDVYSLGATLYSLLTGRPAFEGDDLGLVLQAVRKGEFPPPRSVDPTIDRALEAVCLKAMAIKADDRYASCRSLAEDIERWAADEPVTAWHEPASRRLLRWLTRHRTGVTAAGAAVLVAVAGMAAVLAVQTRANADLKHANVNLEAANARERQRFDLAIEAIGLFHGEVSEDLLLKEKAFASLRTRLLKGAADFYGKLERLLEGQADLQSRAALGRAYYELAKLTAVVGDRPGGVSVHRKGLAVRRELAASPGAGAEAAVDVASSLYYLGVTLSEIGDTAGSKASAGEALELAEGLVAAGRGGDEARALLAESLNWASTHTADRQAGLELARRAQAIARELAGKNPEAPPYLQLQSDSQSIYGSALSALGRRDEAIAAYLDGAAILERLIEAQPGKFVYQDYLARDFNNIAVAQAAQGKLTEATASQRRAVAIWRKVAEANPAAVILGNNVGFGLNSLAYDLLQGGRPGEALAALEEARTILQRLADANPGSISFPRNLARNHGLAAQALARLGRMREARGSQERSLALRQKIVDAFPSDNEVRRSLARELTDVGWNLWKVARAAEALAIFERERAIWSALAAAGSDAASDRERLANCETNTAAALISSGRLAEARACCDRAIAIRDNLLQGEPANEGYAQGLAESLLRSGGVRAAVGDLAGAASDWHRAEALFASHPPNVMESMVFWACCRSSMAGLAGKAGSGISSAEGAAYAEGAMALLRRAIAGDYRELDHVQAEHGLDPLRSRPDFQLLMMDLAFPTDPFAK
jgi:eukaryotic-like serine/threonine-protein kinase